MKPHSFHLWFISCTIMGTAALCQATPVEIDLDPGVYEVDGGYAPRVLERDEPTAFRENQTFQIVDGVWIFETGDAWRGETSQYSTAGAHIVTFDLLDLVIAEAE